MQTLMTLMTLVLLAAGAATSIEYDAQVDFSRYKTWSWHRAVTPAENSVVDKSIRGAIEKGLSGRGVSRVEAGGTLYVSYHASKTTEIGLEPIRNVSAPAGVRYAEKGALVVEVLDAESGSVVWRALVSGALKHEPSFVPDQVAAAIEALFEKFPGRSAR
jgi:hypothetical protein